MKEEVQDRFGVVWFIFVVLGTGTLLPWNVFLTEQGFYAVRLMVPPKIDFISQNFMSLFGLVFNTANLCALGLLIKYQKYLSLRVLILQPLVVTFIMLVSTAGMALKTSMPGDVVAKFTLPSLALMGVCMASLQGATVQLASMFSVKCIRGVISGIAIGGLVTSSLSFLSQLRGTGGNDTGVPAEDVAPAAFLYFSASAAVIASCIAGYALLPVLPYGRYKLLLAGIIDDPKERQLLTVDEDYEEPLLTVVENDGSSTSSGLRSEHTRAAIISVESDWTLYTRSWQHRHAFKIYCSALFFTLGLSMCCHPGISTFICSVHNSAETSPCAPNTEYGRLYGDLFVPMLYVLFALGDYLGRLFAGYGPWAKAPPKPLIILAYSLLRVVLPLALIFCHVVTPHRWLLREYFDNDWVPLSLILTLGLTQGHLISIICMHAPSKLLPTQQSKFGPVTSFAISAGCFIGSFVSMGLSHFFQADS